MVLKQEGGMWYVFSHEGKKLSKGYKDKAEAAKRLKQVEYFKHAKEADLHYTVPITECEVIEKEGEKPTKVAVSGTCLKPTLSRNSNLYKAGNIEENDGKEVKFFVQQHGDLELKNVVGKVTLTKEAEDLKYRGILRNTKQHPDVVEHAINGEIDVSIDARAKGMTVEEVDGQKVYSYKSVDIRALCGVGIGGISENTMEAAIAESFNIASPEEEDDNEVNKVDETETLKKSLEEKELALKEAESRLKAVEEAEKLRAIEEKNAVIENIVKVNPELKKEILSEKELPELKLVLEYENKLKAKASPPTGNGLGREASLKESDGIIVNEKEDVITMTDTKYAEFSKDVLSGIYR